MAHFFFLPICPFLSASLINFLPVCYFDMPLCHVGGCSLIHQTARVDMLSTFSPASLAVFPSHSCMYKQVHCRHATALTDVHLDRPVIPVLLENHHDRDLTPESVKKQEECVVQPEYTRPNSHIITFPDAIFQLARHRSACKSLDALCLSLAGLKATFCLRCFGISQHSGGGQATLHGKLSMYAEML